MSARTLTRSTLAGALLAALCLVASPAAATPPPVGPEGLLPPGPQPDQPGVSIGDSWAYEADGDIYFDITLDAPASLGDNVTVGFTHLGTDAEDFTSQGFNVSFAEGWTSATLPIALTQFDGVEDPEHFQMVLLDPVGLEIEDGVGNGVLYDANGPVIDIADGEVVEGDPGESTHVGFEVTLSYAVPEIMSLRFATTEIDEEALADVDYEPVDHVMLWGAGSTSATYEVTIVEDELIEADEVFVAWIADPSVGTIDDDTAVGTIVDDDVLEPDEEDVPEDEDENPPEDEDETPPADDETPPEDDAEVEGAAVERAGLPSTGSPTLALGVVGSGLLAGGSLLVLWRRRRHEDPADA